MTKVHVTDSNFGALPSLRSTGLSRVQDPDSDMMKKLDLDLLASAYQEQFNRTLVRQKFEAPVFLSLEGLLKSEMKGYATVEYKGHPIDVPVLKNVTSERRSIEGLHAIRTAIAREYSATLLLQDVFLSEKHIIDEAFRLANEIDYSPVGKTPFRHRVAAAYVELYLIQAWRDHSANEACTKLADAVGYPDLQGGVYITNGYCDDTFVPGQPLCKDQAVGYAYDHFLGLSFTKGRDLLAATFANDPERRARAKADLLSSIHDSGKRDLVLSTPLEAIHQFVSESVFTRHELVAWVFPVETKQSNRSCLCCNIAVKCDINKRYTHSTSHGTCALLNFLVEQFGIQVDAETGEIWCPSYTYLGKSLTECAQKLILTREREAIEPLFMREDGSDQVFFKTRNGYRCVGKVSKPKTVHHEHNHVHTHR